MQLLPANSSLPVGEGTTAILNDYSATLISGNATQASAIVDAALASGLSPSQVYLGILLPAHMKIAELCSSSKLGVCEEHRATQITLSEMTRLRFSIKPRARLGLKAAIASVDGEDHYIGARVVADFLFMDGWEIHFLGARTPIKDLISFLQANKFDLVGLAAVMPEALIPLEETIREIRTLDPAPKIIVGGSCVYSNLEKVKGFKPDAIAFDATEAVTLARSICGVSAHDLTLAQYLKELGERILAARKLRKFSQQKLADASGLDRAYISSVENGKQNVTVGAIAKLADALDLRLNDLLVSQERSF